MKQGRTLVELATELQRQRETRKDLVVDTRNIDIAADARHVIIKDYPVDLGMNELFHHQLCDYTKVPTAYYDRCRDKFPELAATNMNEWLHAMPAPRLVRTLDGNGRAFMSNAYRALDNFELCEAALPRLSDKGVVVLSCEVTERRLYLKVVDERIKRDLPVGVMLGQGHHRFDTVSPALVLSNSEVGHGSLQVNTSVYTGGCTNMAVIKERSQRNFHLGSRQDLGDEVWKLLSDDTRRLTDAALWAQIGDVVEGAFDLAQFDAIVEKITATTKNEIKSDDIPKTVEVISQKLDIREGERPSVLNWLIKGGDLTQYGLHAAVTRAAQDVESYDRASELERLGGRVLELSPTEWERIAA